MNMLRFQACSALAVALTLADWSLAAPAEPVDWAAAARALLATDAAPAPESDRVWQRPVGPVDPTEAPPPQLLVTSGADAMLVPLPPAAWSGMAGLGVLLLPPLRKRFSRLIR